MGEYSKAVECKSDGKQRLIRQWGGIDKSLHLILTMCRQLYSNINSTIAATTDVGIATVASGINADDAASQRRKMDVPLWLRCRNSDLE